MIRSRHSMMISGLLAACTVCFAQQSSTQIRPRTVTGEVRILSKFHSRILENDRDIAIFLPPNYDKETSRKYPVLYMEDGQNLFNLGTSYLPDQEWRVDEIATSLIESGLIEPIIVVGVYNAGADRGNEYLPTKVRDTGGKADLYGRMLVEELKPMIDSTYRTKPGARDTGLAGSSFGGIVSMYLGTKYSNVFGKLAVMSPSVWWDNRVILKYVDALPKKTGQRIWLDIGTAEGNASSYKTVEDDAATLRDHLTAKGWKLGKDLAYFRDFGAHHNETAWAGRMDAVLVFLFGR